MNIKGTVPNSGALPSTGNTQGDAWVADDTDHIWVWNGTTWVDAGAIEAGIPEAPVNGQQYARKDAAWSVVVEAGNEVTIAATPPAQPCEVWVDTSTTAFSAGPWQQLTQAQYNALSPPDANTLYIIIG